MSDSSIFNIFDLVNDAIDKDFFFDDVRVSPRFFGHPQGNQTSKQLTSGTNANSSSQNNALVHSGNNTSVSPFSSLFGHSSVFDVQAPPLDIIDRDSTYDLRIAIPGVPKENIKLDFDDSKKELTISGELQEKFENNEEDKGEAKKGHQKSRVYKEIRSGSFMRRVRFGKDANLDSENIKASLTNGVLDIIVPKIIPSKSEKENIKRITIDSGDN